MKWIFYIIGIVTLLSSMGSCVLAKSSVHEAAGAAVGIIAVVALGVGALLEKLDAVEKTIRDQAYELGKAVGEIFPKR